MVYACREYARRAVDVLARRTRLAFLNVPAAEEALPRVIQIMAQELKWSKAKQKVGLSQARGRGARLNWSVCQGKDKKCKQRFLDGVCLMGE